MLVSWRPNLQLIQKTFQSYFAFGHITVTTMMFLMIHTKHLILEFSEVISLVGQRNNFWSHLNVDIST